MKRKITSLLFAAAAFLAVLFFCESSFNKTAEDILYHSPGGTSEKIRIIRIDDKSIQALGNYSGWDRSVYAELVEALCVSDDVKPAVIGFDIVFDSDYGTEADKAFADACAAHGNVGQPFLIFLSVRRFPTKTGI